jgi:hypothetical protein
MRRWILGLGAVALLAAGAGIFIVVNIGWPKYWATELSAGISPLRYVLLAILFVPFLVRAWAGRDSYNDRGADAFILLGINVAVVAAVVWLVTELSRPVLLAAIVIGIQGAFTYKAWRRARSLQPRARPDKR